MSSAFLDDPFICEQIDHALEPWAAALEPEELTWLREQLAYLLEEDSEGRAALQGAHPRNVDQSGECANIGSVDVAPEREAGDG